VELTIHVMGTRLDRFDARVQRVLGQLSPAGAVAVSIATAAVLGGGIPWAFRLDRPISLVWVVAGAILATLPVLAVAAKGHNLEIHRLLLVQTGYLDGLGTFSGSEFEHLIAALYESQGFDATVIGGTGDGGIDIEARRGEMRLAIQCKHWKTKKVGPREVRELRGAILDTSVTPVLVTSGLCSDATRNAARERGVDLLVGVDLIRQLQELVSRISPHCPLCERKMVPKDGSRGKFWSCITFPTCRGSEDFYPPLIRAFGRTH
jgi:hypothetical protein